MAEFPSRMGRKLLLAIAPALFLTVGIAAPSCDMRADTQQPGREQPALPSSTPDEVSVNPATVAKRVAPRPGDICLQCNRPIGAEDVVYGVRGQRMPLHRTEVEPDLRAQLARLLSQIEPRGAFLGAGQPQAAMGRAWFFAGLYVLIGLVSGALCAHRAMGAGQNPYAWFVAGLLLNVIGVLFLLTRPRCTVWAPAGVPRGVGKIAATYAPMPCSKCGGLNHPSAAGCTRCGAHLEPKTISEVARVGRGHN